MRDAYAHRAEQQKIEALERDLRTEYPELAELETERDGLDAALTEAACQKDGARWTDLQMRKMAVPYEIQEARLEALRRLKARLYAQMPSLKAEVDQAGEEAVMARRNDDLDAAKEAQSRQRQASEELERVQDRVREIDQESKQ